MTKTTAAAICLCTTLAVLGGCGEAGAGDEAAGAMADTSRVADPGPQQGASVDPRVVCDTITNSFRCARAIEELQLPGAEEAERRGDTLLLAVEGDTVRLADSGEGARVVRYSFQEHWPQQGYFIVHEQHYEGSEYLLVNDESGERNRIPERPLPSPGGDLFAVLSMDLVAGYGPNTVQVWDITGEDPDMAWELEPEGWGPDEGRWTGPATLTFTRACEPGATEHPEEFRCGTTATVTRTGGDWGMEETNG